MPDRLDLRDLLVPLGGALLLISLFLRWFGPAAEAWDVFEVVDLVLAAVAVAALAYAARTAPPRLRAALPWLAVVAVVLVAGSIADPPPVAGEDPERGPGAWLALVAACLLALAALLRHARISVRVDVGGRAGEPVAPPPPPPHTPAADRPPATSAQETTPMAPVVPPR